MPKRPAPFANLVLLGDAQVGKSSLLTRWSDDSFPAKFAVLLGFHLSSILGRSYDRAPNKMLDLDFNVNTTVFDPLANTRKLRMKEMLDYRDAAIIVFSVTDRQSFESLSHWYNKVKAVDERTALQSIICGNQCDMKERVVSAEEGQQLAAELQLSYFEVSALSGDGVADAISTLANRVNNHRLEAQLIADDRFRSAHRSEDSSETRPSQNPPSDNSNPEPKSESGSDHGSKTCTIQ